MITHNKLKSHIQALVGRGIQIENRWGDPRIKGKTEVMEALYNETTRLMIVFHIWIDNNFIKIETFEANKFYIEKNNREERYTIEDLILKYLETPLEI